jgi:hypothetical protein
LLQCIPAAIDGSQVAMGVLLDNVNATAGDTPCVVITRQAEMNQKEMNYGAMTGPQIITANGQLAAPSVMIIVR